MSISEVRRVARKIFLAKVYTGPRPGITVPHLLQVGSAFMWEGREIMVIELPYARRLYKPQSWLCDEEWPDHFRQTPGAPSSWTMRSATPYRVHSTLFIL